MRIKVTKTDVYKFEELPDDIKQKAIDKLGYINVSHDWWDCVYEDAKEIGLKITGFDIDRGSYCKGKFTLDAEEVAQNIINNHGETCETYKTAKSFLDEVIPLIECRDTFADDDETTAEEYKIFDDNTEKIEELEDEFLKSLREDYRIMLQKEFEYLTSEEAIIETIKANDYEFDEKGDIA